MKLMRKSLSNQIYTVLKKEILHGAIPFGSKLVNRQLQSRFDVSSSPVRDAINRLYLDGLVSSITQSGAVVVEFTLDFYTEVNEVLPLHRRGGRASCGAQGRSQRGRARAQGHHRRAGGLHRNRALLRQGLCFPQGLYRPQRQRASQGAFQTIQCPARSPRAPFLSLQQSTRVRHATGEHRDAPTHHRGI